jgi:23S rRNA C2498 (ribose-2'-O)-methylase RlmM
MANTTGKKYGGRKKGTPNKVTKELRSVLKDLMFEEFEVLREKLDELDTRDRIEVVIKMMPYIMPKVDSISHTINEPIDWAID